MCGITDLSGCVSDIASAASKGFFSMLEAGVNDMMDFALDSMFSWIFVPSVNVDASPIHQIQTWMVPITSLVVFVSIIWQGIKMAVEGRGQPLFQLIKGLFMVAFWGAVGIAGTELALKMGDSWSVWIINQSHDASHGVSFGDVFFAGIMTLSPLTAIILAFIVTISIWTQLILMIFREGAILILAPQLQLAAAGAITGGGSRSFHKVMSWLLTLIVYKPVAATIIAVGQMLARQTADNDPRLAFMGMAVMLMSLIALPAMMRFFNWAFESIGEGPNMQPDRGEGGFSAQDMAQGGKAINQLAKGGAGGGSNAAEHAGFMSSSLPVPSGAMGAAGGGGAAGAAGASGASGAAGAAGAAGASGALAAAGPIAVVADLGIRAAKEGVTKAKSMVDQGMRGA